MKSNKKSKNFNRMGNGIHSKNITTIIQVNIIIKIILILKLF